MTCKNPLRCLVVDLRTQNDRIGKIPELIDPCPECGSVAQSRLAHRFPVAPGSVPAVGLEKEPLDSRICGFR